MLNNISADFFKEICKIENSTRIIVNDYQYGLFLVRNFVCFSKRDNNVYYLTDENNNYISNSNSVLPSGILVGHHHMSVKERQKAYKLLSDYIEANYTHLLILNAL